MPAARMTPETPKLPVTPVFGGTNGTQRWGWMNGMAPMITARMASIFSPTTTSFTRADRRVPRMISQAVNRVISTAGRSSTLPLRTTWPSITASGAPVMASGRLMPKECRVAVA